MFYEGDLQSGIGKALQESKLVGCFVTDSGEESQLWENEFLQEESLKESLTEQTVLLRLVAGSQEAGYLAAIYPLPKTPTFVLIKSGELKEYLISGVSKEDFLRRLGAALESRGPSSQPPPSNSTTTPSTSSNILANMEVNTSELASSSSSAAQNARIQQQTANLTATLAERTRRLAAQKRDLDAAEKAKNAADAKARKEAADAGNPKAVSEQKHAKQQAQRQREAREEKARILKRVEDDKATRREKEAQRKADAKAKLEGEKEIEKAVNESSASPLPARGGANAKECAVQVRLFDGSTIRSRFASQGSLMKDVRPWVDEKQDGDVPYTFKQVLSPLPNKNIEMSEEEKSLVALGLTPSATLILIPVSGYTSAYEAGNGGIVSRAASGGYALISSSVGMVAGALGSLLGGTAAPANVQPVSSGPPVPSAAINVRTLRDQRQESKKDDQQFYNGNSTNFKPRRDDDEGKDD